MPADEKLDSWKTCHALVLAVYKDTEEAVEREPMTANRLRYLALRAAGKLAFGSGTGSRTMLRHAAEYSAGHLTELGHDLVMTEATGLLSKDRCERLQALCGRAHFYVLKHILPPVLPPDTDPQSPGAEC
jgi:hypothetical protein